MDNQPSANDSTTPIASPKARLYSIARDVVVIVFLDSFAVFGAKKLTGNAAALTIGLAMLFLKTVGFTISAFLADAHRLWRHLAIVATGVCLIKAAQFGSLEPKILGNVFVVTGIAMGLGGAIAMIFRRKPQIVDSTNQNSWHHAAANFCLCAPFIGILLNVTVWGPSRIAHPPQTQVDAIAGALLAGAIPIFGFLAGVVALFGIKRYGRNGILWKAVAGMVIFLLMILLAIPNYLKAREISRQRYEQRYPN